MMNLSMLFRNRNVKHMYRSHCMFSSVKYKTKSKQILHLPLFDDYSNKTIADYYSIDVPKEVYKPQYLLNSVSDPVDCYKFDGSRLLCRFQSTYIASSILGFRDGIRWALKNKPYIDTFYCGGYLFKRVDNTIDLSKHRLIDWHTMISLSIFHTPYDLYDTDNNFLSRFYDISQLAYTINAKLRPLKFCLQSVASQGYSYYKGYVIKSNQSKAAAIDVSTYPKLSCNEILARKKPIVVFSGDSTTLDLYTCDQLKFLGRFTSVTAAATTTDINPLILRKKLTDALKAGSTGFNAKGFYFEYNNSSRKTSNYNGGDGYDDGGSNATSAAIPVIDGDSDDSMSLKGFKNKILSQRGEYRMIRQVDVFDINCTFIGRYASISDSAMYTGLDTAQYLGLRMKKARHGEMVCYKGYNYRFSDISYDISKYPVLSVSEVIARRHKEVDNKYGISVEMYDSNNTFIRRYPSMMSASKDMHIPYTAMRVYSKGRQISDKLIRINDKYKMKLIDYYKEQLCSSGDADSKTFTRRRIGKDNVSVDVFDQQGLFIGRYISLVEAGRMTDTNEKLLYTLRRTCVPNVGIVIINGYIFKQTVDGDYAVDAYPVLTKAQILARKSSINYHEPAITGDSENYKYSIDPNKTSGSRCVDMYTADGNTLIKTFYTVKDAAKAMLVSPVRMTVLLRANEERLKALDSISNTSSSDICSSGDYNSDATVFTSNRHTSNTGTKIRPNTYEKLIIKNMIRCQDYLFKYSDERVFSLDLLDTPVSLYARDDDSNHFVGRFDTGTEAARHACIPDLLLYLYRKNFISSDNTVKCGNYLYKFEE